jgi:diphthamide synthase (EF-2-diphthine--ammonia ligase)
VLFTPAGEGQRDGLVALPLWVLLAQAAAMNCVLVSRAGTFSDDQEIMEELHGLHAQGVRQAVFVSTGSAARDSRYSRIGMVTGLAPQWISGRWSRQEVLDRLVAGRIEAMCVGVNTRFLPAWFCGRRFDKEFLDDLPHGVDALGTNGEFRTCVTQSLLFHAPVSLTVNGRYRYRSSDVEGDSNTCWTAFLKRPRWTS